MNRKKRPWNKFYDKTDKERVTGTAQFAIVVKEVTAWEAMWSGRHVSGAKSRLQARQTSVCRPEQSSLSLAAKLMAAGKAMIR